MKTTAIIVAAGSGSRFQSDTPKQFLELSGKPILFYSLERFEAAPSVDAITLVLPVDRVNTFDTENFSKVNRVVTGGGTRAQSVMNGLNAVDDETSIVAVHDGARPLVTLDDIERTIAKAKEAGAACLVTAVTDTIKSIQNGEIAATLDRDKLRRALTPQAFKIEILRGAFAAMELNATVTDECYLVEKFGYPIALVEGSGRNIKITDRDDLLLAETILNSIVSGS